MNGNKPTPPELENGQEYHIFISHSHEDKKVAEEMMTVLKKENYKCCNVTDDFIPGRSVHDNIVECITSSKKVVFIFSPDSLKSDWVNFEVGFTRSKEGRTKKVTMIPVLLNIDINDKDIKLPEGTRQTNVLTWGETSFWDKFQKALSVDELSSLVPAGDIANGLAWSYFYGYLKLVLPGMSKRVADILQTEEWKKWKDTEFLDKMMIIMPDSGFCPMGLKSDDENIEHVGFIPFQASRAGNINRDYKSSVYSVKDPKSNKVVLVIAEFATPLMSMYEMEIGLIAGLDKPEKVLQTKNFQSKLKEILEHENNKECNQAYCFLSLEDERDEHMKPLGWKLSEKIATRAFEELDTIKGMQNLKIVSQQEEQES